MTHNGHCPSPENAEAIRRAEDAQRFDVVCANEEEIYRKAYREASQRLSLVLNSLFRIAIEYCERLTKEQHECPLCGPPRQKLRRLLWQAAYALGLPICGDLTMTERADKLGVVRATMSKGAKFFQRSNNLPPSIHMKEADSTKAFSDARKKNLHYGT